MGKNDRCCVGPCDNDKRYPEKIKKEKSCSGNEMETFS